MLARMPETIHQAWGEAAARDFVVWLEDAMTERTVKRSEWEEMRSRFDDVETRLSNVETRLAVVEAGLAELRADLRELRREMNERFDRVNERFDRLNALIIAQTRWTVGTLALFGTIIAILVGIGQLTP